MKTSLIFSLLLSFILIDGANAQRFNRRKIELACKHIAPIEHSYLSRHITYSKPNANLESRTIEQFIKKLDPTKIYLLKSDVVQIKKEMKGVFQATRQKDCSKIKKAQATYKKRVDERVTFVKKYLSGKKFKINKKTTFVFDPQERKYPATVAQANMFHKKYLQFQVANYVASDIKLPEAKKNVIKNYDRVDKRVKDFTDPDLWSMYLDSFARSLDPHSSYLSADQLEDFEISMRLSLEGIGATLSSKDGFTVIEQLIPGGAAERSGKLKPKDKIIAVGQGDKGKLQDVVDMSLRNVVRLIRGPKGTKVNLQILRKEAKGNKRFSVVLVRAKIKLEDEAANIQYLDRTVGDKSYKVALLNLPSFYADNRKKGRSATKDMARLIEQAKKHKASSIVLDLSTNGGGSLDDAVKIAGLFFKTGNVVKQSSRDPSRGEITLADQDPDVNWRGPLVVLTSRISASASEIVSGTLQDYRRAIIVGGDHTFGKGSVQSVEPLPPGLGALKTTVGMFFIPGGNSTQHRGVRASIVFPSAYSNDEIGEKTLDYSLPPKRIKSFISKDAFVHSGPMAWKPVTKKEIQQLNLNSQLRIKGSDDFQKLIADIKKAKKKGKAISVADVLKKTDDKKKDDDDDSDKILTHAEKEAKYRKRPDIQEAVNIAADLVALENNIPITIGKTTEKKSENSQAKSPN